MGDNGHRRRLIEKVHRLDPEHQARFEHRLDRLLEAQGRKDPQREKKPRRRLTRQERRLAWQLAKMLRRQARQVLWGAITGRKYFEDEDRQTDAARER